MIPGTSYPPVSCACCTACNPTECRWSWSRLSSTAADGGNRGRPPPPGNRHERRRLAALERPRAYLSAQTGER